MTSPGPRISSRLAAALSATAFFAGCGGAPADDPDAPLELSASNIEILGTSESLAVVQDLEVLPDGSVWVFNSVEPYFIGFGRDGESLGAHGRAGGGPEEFPMPSAFLAGGWEGEAWIFDLRRHAMIRISRPDADWTEIPLRSESLPPGSIRGGMNLLSAAVRTARLGGEIIVPRPRPPGEAGMLGLRLSLLGSDLVAVDPETAGIRILVTLGDVLDDPSGDFVPSEGGFPQWYRLWAPCGENLVRVYDRVRNQLRGFDGSGSEVAPVDLPPVPFTEVSPRQFAGAVFELRQAELTGDVRGRLGEADRQRLLNQMAQGVSGSPQELATYLPHYVDFRCSEDGTIWLHPFDPDAGGLNGGPRWLRISPDAGPRDVHLPDRFDALRFSDSRIWGVYRDELDVPSVASIPLPTG
ncbi:MAG: hypothetical protein F4043_01585 [Gammaproteobacteria bacterium]|nr:hypothetical protein [Gammaproteobacteria bacterium]MYI21411.1 hypothetical protein [Gammaproteobacteria bacterium]